uniref:Uncharacterized protein n=1 Tax=Plectus sambesii TaxID=2011161 RepID=A0A914WSX1_9BILA
MPVLCAKEEESGQNAPISASPTLPPLQNSWSSHSIQSNASGSSSLSSSSSFTRIGSLRKAGSAAIKNLKLLGSRQTFGGSVEHIPVDDEQDTANRARMALSSSPSPEDSDRLLMPPPAKAPPTRVRPKSSKPSD